MNKGRVFAVLVFSLLFGLSPLAAAPVIERGIDVFTTPADGKTFYDFARDPIPAGFFCKNSKPFKGRVNFKGLPLVTEAPGQLGSTDTVVERLDDAVFNDAGRAITRVQFRALSLVSIAPIKTNCGEFHTYVSLRAKQRVTKMNIFRTRENGGHFIAPLAVDARMTFIPVKPQKAEARKLELMGKVTFPAISIPWSLTDGAKKLDFVVVDTNGDLIADRLLPGPSNFFPGQSTGSPDKTYCCWEYSCHAADGHEHCFSYLPWGCTGECP